MHACLYTTVLEEVKDTYHDVRRLEASILELHKMFMDLALLVDRQGEMLDQIEYQVKNNENTNHDFSHLAHMAPRRFGHVIHPMA